MLPDRRRAKEATCCLLAAAIVCTAMSRNGNSTEGNAMATQFQLPGNDAVRWSGTRFGLIPTLPEESEAIAAKGQSAVPALLDALTDPVRFVTAHVLLTRVTGIQHETFPRWNGLEVDLQPSGAVIIDPDQRLELARRWASYFRMAPRPDTLPPAN
jgi:hypothetical protein